MVDVRGLLDALPGQAALLDVAGCVREVNRAWKAMPMALALSGARFEIGSDYAARCEASGGEGVRVAQTVRRVLNGAPGAEIEYRCAAKQGLCWLRCRVTAIDSSPRAVLVTHSDLTPEKQAQQSLAEQERSYSVLLANVRGMAYRCRNDRDWSMELVSDGCLDITGYPADQLRDNASVSFNDLIHPDDQGPLWEKCQRNLDAKLPCSNEYRITTASGEQRWVWDQAHGVYGAHDELLAIEGLITDISAAKRAAEDRDRLEAQLQQAQKLETLGQLAGGVAHDFNNILTAINAYAQRIEDGATDDGAKQAGKEIMRASGRAASLIARLLGFARKQNTTPRLVFVNDLVTDCLSMLRSVIGEHIEVTTQLGDRLAPVRVDPAQYEQVLLNLVVNARDAMPKGGELRIETLDNGEWVETTVSDTGAGMDNSTLAHIFEPFFTTKSEGDGTGLGLAMCYGVARQNRGRMRVTSTPGQGSSFTLALPASLGAVALDAPEAAAPARLAQDSCSVLLVEDDDMIRGVVCEILRERGYDVTSAAAPNDAIEIAANNDFAIVVTDVIMPQMRGTHLIDLLTSARPDLRVLYLSGYAAEDMDGRLNTRIGFLAKPFTATQLDTKIREILAAE